jgi:molybdopterin molybdotransferase
LGDKSDHSQQSGIILRRDPTINAENNQALEPKLISVEDAQANILSHISPLGEEIVDLAQATGRVLAQRLYSRVALPQFDNSSMDGFAVRCADTIDATPNTPVELVVIGDVPAGSVFGGKLAAHQAVRIMTGASIPDGADGVIPVEQTDFSDQRSGTPVPATVKIYQRVSPGDNIRPRGQDMSQGELALEPGIRLRPQEIGFLAMLGIAQVLVHRRVRVALFSTGDELIPLDSPVRAGKIYESNSYMLAALIEKYYSEVISLGIIADQEIAVRECLYRAAQNKADLIVSSAGVSVGALDFVRSVMEKDGKLEFWRVNMRPGKPVAFGEFQGIPFIGLPGNPVSAFVGAEFFIRPVLLKMGGQTSWQKPSLLVRVNEPIESDGRASYLRACIRNENGEWFATLTGHQGSGNLRSLVQANALLFVPSGVKSLPIGSEALAYLLDDE